jgi:Domain of unknown function (DUF4129)
MDTMPQQPSSSDENEARRRRSLREMGATRVSGAVSWGERALPLVFAAMETCWVDAILIALASIHFFGLSTPLVALWAPFVLMVGSGWLAMHLERREIAAARAGKEAKTDASLLFGVMGVVTLLVIWDSVYSASIAVYDPRWLLTLLNDVLLLSPAAYHVMGVILLSAYFCWRGIRLVRRAIEPGTVFRAMRLGLGVFVVVILIRAGTGGGFFNELQLLVLIALFLSFALLGHALSNALFIRLFHPVGLQGSVRAQERALLLVVGSVCVCFMLITFLVGAFTSPAFLVEVQRALAPVGQAYNWLVSMFAYAVVFLLTPLFWLISQLHPQLPPRVRLQRITPQQAAKYRPSAGPPEAVLATISVLKVVLPILVIALLVFLIWRLVRRRQTKLVQRDEDEYESLWSWDLFWMQLKMFWQAFWQRLFRKRTAAKAESEKEPEMVGEPMARSVREIYRALLRWAAMRGYPRKKDETPYEFKLRLGEHLPQAEPQLSAVTEAYTAIRYSEAVPDLTEVVQVQQNWVALQQKMQTQ